MSRSVPTPRAAAPAAPKASPTTARSRAARRRIDEEHRQLGELLRHLTQTHELHRVGALLDELAELLGRHFAGEEGSEGLHQVVAEGAVHRLPNLQQLVEEHGLIAARLEELRRETQAALDGPMLRIREEIGWLVDTLRRHEEKEEALFGEAFYSDLGSQ